MTSENVDRTWNPAKSLIQPFYYLPMNIDKKYNSVVLAYSSYVKLVKKAVLKIVYVAAEFQGNAVERNYQIVYGGVLGLLE